MLNIGYEIMKHEFFQISILQILILLTECSVISVMLIGFALKFWFFVFEYPEYIGDWTYFLNSVKSYQILIIEIVEIMYN